MFLFFLLIYLSFIATYLFNEVKFEPLKVVSLRFPSFGQNKYLVIVYDNHSKQIYDKF